MPRSNPQTQSSLKLLAPEPLDYNEQLTSFQHAFGSDGPIGALPALPQSDAFAQAEAKKKREANTTTGDYVSAAVRQDSPVDGIVANYVGSQYLPDPSFNPYDPKVYTELTKGLPEEYHNEMLKAESMPHALYIRSRLDDKMADLQKLGDLGVPGNIARFLGNFVEPTNMAIGLAGGGVTSLVKGAGLAAKAGAGLTAAGAGGYAFERARQRYNFEDSQGDAVWAGLMGMAFSAPFVGLHAHEMARIRQIATRELEVLNAARDNTPTAAVNDAAKAIDAARIKAAPEWTSFPPEAENGPVRSIIANDPLWKVPSVEDWMWGEAEPRAAFRVDLAEQLSRDPEYKSARASQDAAAQQRHDATVAKISEMQDRGAAHRELSGIAQSAPEGPMRDALLRALAPPSGFIESGSLGSGQVARIPMELTPLAKWRFDTYARMNKSQNPVIQAIGEKFFKNAIVNVDAEGVPVRQERTTGEEKAILRRTIAGNFHHAAAAAREAAFTKMGLGPIQRAMPSAVDDFYKKVGRAMRDPRVLEDNPAIRPELEQAVAAARGVYAKSLEEMHASGVKGAEALKANPDYMNRVWLQHAIREAEHTHGEDSVRRLVAASVKDREPILTRFREKNPDSKLSDQEVLEKSAGKFIDSIMALEHSHLSTEMLLAGHDAPTLRAELKNRTKLSPSEIESLIDNLFEVQEAASGDAGKPANLKYRFNLDESTRIQTDAGTLSLTDLMENDARLLVDRYSNSMLGHVAAAKRAGVRSRSDFDALLREAEQDHVANRSARDVAKFNEEMQMAKDIYDNLVGRPMSIHSFNVGDRTLNTVRTYARSVYLGQLGFTAANEAFHSAGLMTWRAAIDQMPSLKEFWQATRAGHVPSEGLAQDVQQMLGNLNEHVSGYLRQHEVTDHTYGNKMHTVENVANSLSHATDKLSGNSFMTALTRGMAAAGTIQKYANFARGRTALTEAQRARLVGAGIDGRDIDRVLSHLKDHVALDGNRVVGVNWEEWSAKEPRTYHDFLTAVDREVRQGVQDHDIGETWMFQHTALGKFFTELRAYNIAGHSKQMLNSFHYRDRTSLQLWSTSLIVNAMAYMTQTSMNFGHDPKELEKRLTAERIVRAAFQRSNMMGIAPFITDTLVPGFVPFVHATGQGLTANTDSRNLLMPPSFNLVAKGVNFLQNGDVKSGVSILPFSNTYGTRNLTDMFGKAYPQTKPH